MLTDRQKLILGAVVEDYVFSAEPVGSRTLSKHERIRYSAATIRNEMADLEEMGYLAQPHTSAGRVPSQRGYRFYVDHLMMQTEIDAQTVQRLREVFQQRIDAVERMIQQTAVVVSQLTSYTSIVSGPRRNSERIRQVQIIALSPGCAVAIVVTNTGTVYDRPIRLPDDMSAQELERLVNLLNSKLAGSPLAYMKSTLHQEIARDMAGVLEHYEGALGVLDELLRVAEEKREPVFVGGAINVLAQPEFHDVEKARPLLALLEQVDALYSVLPDEEGGISVRIGEENAVPALQDCTVIAATYSVGGQPVGRIGVLGPTRMNYARVMQILDYTAGALTDTLQRRLG
ncbi:MAG: heat-inducible transcription repressor HrcA [Thermoflavifilum sp.]|uniref:heat-inducible transcriptional repressor HrcA n=1 Tax=Alicyclobacillus shizuokensis TaxID=392014 RepID=UPI0008343337|nr:heat-inducible transcriptional repressor HrcA [Alicyclobacillus shizuokensis]MBX6351853.1 heat-inducible transcription repressor HrcA [Thermoflavifilum sp.]MCL6512936.1 heat-inducible transcriptional repressor HrcA [Alicyclobacillus sp.]